ncbi:astacin-like metalloendopeptidase [Scyliorhinus canicula]|uniref:astacin-like metalloendopeptidase n=1 Tax=Scyliorhinus canicula TaxID=7830 RepID=UPI0018F6DC02|nr:astacin-like metalloendopeptidase [Scyliorhinus canicula]
MHKVYRRRKRETAYISVIQKKGISEIEQEWRQPAVTLALQEGSHWRTSPGATRPGVELQAALLDIRVTAASQQRRARCFASIGYGGNAQTLSLQVPECIYFGVIQHEFLHALGFHHEHCRSDRNRYVRVFLENVMPDLQYNFDVLQTNNLGTEYDYDSVMHYGKTVFSRNGFPTILPIPDPSVEIGHMRGISNKDVAKINKLYNCDVCAYMLATRIGSFTSPNFPGLYPNNADCKWIIRVVRRYKILLEFTFFKIRELGGCSADQLNIYDGANKHSRILDGPICGAENPAVMSSRNELFITFTSNQKLQASGFAARYRFIRCGLMLKTRTGQIEGRSFQRKDVYCFWVLLVKRKYQIVLNFERLHILNTTNCEQNHLIIYDVTSTPPVVAARFCDKVSLPVNVISFGRAVVIEFQHTRANFNYGFKITYKSIENKNPPTVSGSSDEGSYCNNVTFMLLISLIKITIVTFIFPLFDVSRS